MRAHGVTVALLVWGTVASAAPADTVRVQAARLTMGALLDITVFAADSTQAAGALESAYAEVARLDTLLTDWRGDGDIARLNAAGDTLWHAVAPETREVVGEALRWAQLSRGAFDPTIRPLVVVWGFRGGVASRAPRADELAAARARVGARFVRVDSAAVRFTRTGMQLDLGGIAKGYALDRAAAVLETHGVRRALLDFAGQALALDAPPGLDAWPVVIDDPRRPRARPLAVVPLVRASVATSSQRERTVTRGGRRVGHILDPRSGRPVRRTRQASAFAARAVDADALATAAFVAGAGDAAQIATRAHASVLVVAHDGRVTRSAKFRVDARRRASIAWTPAPR